MKFRFESLRLLRRLKSFEGSLQKGATGFVLLLGILFLLKQFDVIPPGSALLARIGRVIEVGSVILVALAVIVKLFFIKTAEERVASQIKNHRALEKLKFMIYEWICKKPEEAADGGWRLLENNEDVLRLNTLNYQGFSNSSFLIDRESISKRNHLLLNKNRKIFSLISHPRSPSEIIGYTCLLPLHQESLDLYLRGGIQDKHVSAMHVTSDTEICSAIVIMAIVMDEAYSRQCKRSRDAFLASFIRASSGHLSALADRLALDGYILAQSEKRSVCNVLLSLGFLKTDHVSAEGYPFYKLTLSEMKRQLQVAHALHPADPTENPNKRSAPLP